mmetsp:Transcript_9321/g.10835  ORF Transcript_9321/g.10835 Transcript_9321/m.10835 type:complete len:213 (+) Transcript_9321:230-868(+)
MQRLQNESRDNNTSVMAKLSGEKEHTPESLEGLSEKIRSHIQQSRSINITAGQDFQTTAIVDESGEYDDVMQEWTVHFMKKDQEFPCPVELLNELEIRVGDEFVLSFLHDIAKIDVRIHNVASEGEKSIIFIVGNELMLLGRIHGFPEERSPTDEDAFFEGDLDGLLRMLKSEEMIGTEILFGCIIFKDFVLKSNSFGSTAEEAKDNWETFE